MHRVEAQYRELLEGGKIRCRLCPHECIIASGKRGLCGGRSSRDSVLYSDIYGAVSSAAVDPVEKKPLYHFYPGGRIFSIGTRGCSFSCPFCQNHTISRNPDLECRILSPEDVVNSALDSGSFGIAYTYSEPLIWFEFVKDCSMQARGKGLKNVLVTNGWVNMEPLAEICGFIDAMNIDLKSFREDTYRKYMKASLKPVLDTIEYSLKAGCHIEITTLVVTGMNDSMEEMSAIADYISALDKNIPWHISAYHPAYRYGEKATDPDFIMKVFEMASEKIYYPYCGNIHADGKGTDTICPGCGALLVKRAQPYSASQINLRSGRCSVCGREIYMRGSRE